LRQGVTSRKVALSIPDGFNGIFHLSNPSGSTIKWIPGIFPGGRDSRCIGLTTLPSSCPDCLETWDSSFLGPLRACLGPFRNCFTFLHVWYMIWYDIFVNCSWVATWWQ
jgi:hypothetical protein